MTYSLLASISFSTLSGDSSFSFDSSLFLCLPILGDSLLVCFCFLNWSALTPCLCGVTPCLCYGRSPVGFSGAVSLISWTWFSWDALYAIYVGSQDVTGFWSWLGHSLADWGSLHPPRLVCCCAVVSRTKPQSPGNKSTPEQIILSTIPLSTPN